MSMPRPSRSIFTSPTGSRSSFSHWITVRPGIDAGSMGTTVRERLLGEHEAADVDGAVARQLVQALDDVGEHAHALVVGIEPRALEDAAPDSWS